MTNREITIEELAQEAIGGTLYHEVQKKSK